MQIISDVSNTRLDQFLCAQNICESRNAAARACERGAVKVNGKPAAKKYKLSVGDIVEYDDSASADTPANSSDNIPLDIKYEDDDIMVINKQAGLVCHPATGHADGTLVNALIAYCGEENLANLDGNDNRLGIVHRLDADTSGLMIIAKTNQAGEALRTAMKEHTTKRQYKALVFGHMKYGTGKIECPLIRTIGRNNRPRMSVSDNPKSKYALSTFKTQAHFDDVEIKGYREPVSFSLLEVRIHTGRTHQIRSHMEYIGYPVVGDNLYTKGTPSGFNSKRLLGLDRQFLHAYNVEFEHPITGKIMEFVDELPPDLQTILDSFNKK